MRRRDFLKTLGTALALVPPLARAQQSIKKKRIALISPARPVEGLKTQPYFRALLDELIPNLSNCDSLTIPKSVSL